jgi:hypothetical protein
MALQAALRRLHDSIKHRFSSLLERPKHIAVTAGSIRSDRH